MNHILQSAFLILSALFPPLAAVSVLEQLKKSFLFSLTRRVCVVFIHKKDNCQCFLAFFPAFFPATFHHALITRCNVPRVGYV